MFSKDRSVLTASWFVVSLLLAFIITPDKHADWSTFMVMLSLFAVLFLLPRVIGMAYGTRIKSWLQRQWRTFVPKRKQDTDEPVDRQIESILSASTPPVMPRQEDETRHYDSLVSKVQPELVRRLPASCAPLLSDQNFPKTTHLPFLIFRPAQRASAI